MTDELELADDEDEPEDAAATAADATDVEATELDVDELAATGTETGLELGVTSAGAAELVATVVAGCAAELEEDGGRGCFPAGQATAAEAADTASRMDWNFMMNKMLGAFSIETNESTRLRAMGNFTRKNYTKSNGKERIARTGKLGVNNKKGVTIQTKMLRGRKEST